MKATQTETAPACAKCRYWQPADMDGECRRHAPQAVVLNMDEETKFESHFPITAGEDWCGDFQAK